MQTLLAIAAVAIFLVVVVVGWFANAIDLWRLDRAKQKAAEAKARAEREAADKKRLATERSAQELAEIETFRFQNPTRFLNVPNEQAYQNVFALLDDFASEANALRPVPPVQYDDRFTTIRFPSAQFALARPRSSEGTDFVPQQVIIPLGAPLNAVGWQLQGIYERAAGRWPFPIPPPRLEWERPRTPEFPDVAIPKGGGVAGLSGFAAICRSTYRTNLRNAPSSLRRIVCRT